MDAMTRRIRATAALFAIVAMLFAPLAMALHACPGAGDMAAVDTMMAAMQAPPDDAGGAPMDMALCERHCNDGKVLSFQPLGNTPAPIALPVVAALRVGPLQPVSVRAPAFDSPFAPATGPAPPLIRYTVLRI